MGTLAFFDLVVTELAPDAALVFGRWQLTRALRVDSASVRQTHD